MNIKFKEERDGKGFLASLCEWVCVLTAYGMILTDYGMIFYVFLEGLLAAAGAK